MEDNNNILTVAYYLPQFHRLKFNDDYWGKGFTEWTNTAKAKPLFKGHYQPHIPADLGFYDLNMEDTRRDQARMAQQYGISAFCYWHYWLAKNYEVMDMPFKKVLEDKDITLPFCLAWANHDWHNVKTKEVLIKQEYGGVEDYTCHYKSLSKAFKDERYLRIDGKPIFVVFSPFEIPDTRIFFECWNELAQNDGLKGFFFIGIVKNDNEIQQCFSLGYDAVNTMRLQDFEYKKSRVRTLFDTVKHGIFHLPYRYPFSYAMKYFVTEKEKEENVIPTIISGWDHTPRSGKKALVLDKFSPDVFSQHIENTFDVVKNKKNRIVFIRAWNEWAEGNHLEPDLKYGHGYLEALYRNILKFNEK